MFKNADGLVNSEDHDLTVPLGSVTCRSVLFARAFLYKREKKKQQKQHTINTVLLSCHKHRTSMVNVYFEPSRKKTC